MDPGDENNAPCFAGQEGWRDGWGGSDWWVGMKYNGKSHYSFSKHMVLFVKFAPVTVYLMILLWLTMNSEIYGVQCDVQQPGHYCLYCTHTAPERSEMFPSHQKTFTIKET